MGVVEIFQGKSEASQYRKLSAAGQKKYGADRAKEAAAKNGQFPDTLHMLIYSDYYSQF